MPIKSESTMSEDRATPIPIRPDATANGNGMHPASEEHEVRIVFVSQQAQTREELEQDAFTILDAVEKHAKNAALGPVIACDFEHTHIELEFTVDATKASDVHRCVGEVLDIVEKYVPLAREHESQTKAPRRELALA